VSGSESDLHEKERSLCTRTNHPAAVRKEATLKFRLEEEELQYCKERVVKIDSALE
jgi:hypothetical protein